MIKGFVYKTPQTQEEANVYYRILESFMCNEVIFQDGQATYNQAKDEFNLHLQVAKRIKKESGFLPTFKSDVFYFGIPEFMEEAND